MIEKIGNMKLNDEYYPGEDFYCDGVVEDEILDIVQKYHPDEFNRVITETKEWPVFYHLSHIRGNIVEWLPITKDHSVLEIGSGCGAMTGVLAKKAKNVTCIELSKKRSTINATRNKEFDNVEIMLGNFEEVEKHLVDKFDFITLIGVLEYAESYISTDNPYVDFIKKISKHLKPNGKIVIAIENKLGMKYWAGCQEDHFGGYFLGIENYVGKKGIRTFAKNELRKLIGEAGMTNCEFYYPYPDYKFPITIYSDDYLPKEGDLQTNIRNFDKERYVLFDEEKAFNTIIDEGLFPEFSNSFLVIVGNEDK